MSLVTLWASTSMRSSSRKCSIWLNRAFMDEILSLAEVKELAQLDVGPEGLRWREPLDMPRKSVMHRPPVLAVLLASHSVFLGNRVKEADRDDLLQADVVDH